MKVLSAPLVNNTYNSLAFIKSVRTYTGWLSDNAGVYEKIRDENI